MCKGEGILKTVERCKTAWGDYDGEVEGAREAARKTSTRTTRTRRTGVYHSKTEEYKLSLPYPITTTDVPPETFYYTQERERADAAWWRSRICRIRRRWKGSGRGWTASGNVVDPKTWSGLDPRAAGLARAEWAHVMRGTSKTIRCIEAWDHQVQVILLQGPNQRHKSGQPGRGDAVPGAEAQLRGSDPEDAAGARTFTRWGLRRRRGCRSTRACRSCSGF